MASGRLRVGVWDKDPTVPSGPGVGFGHGVMPHGASESGRDLALVRAYADSRGASLLGEPGGPSGGKVLWAERGWAGP
ncbi:hypothetical protein [Streptomyces sp. NPDC005009]